MLLNRYEVAKVVGMRALQLEEGAMPAVEVQEGDDVIRIAVRELYEGLIDAVVCRDGEYVSVRDCRQPDELLILNTLLGNLRSPRS